MTIVPIAPAQVLSGPAPPIEIRGPSQNLAPGITLAMTTDAAQQYEEFVSALSAALQTPEPVAAAEPAPAEAHNSSHGGRRRARQ